MHLNKKEEKIVAEALIEYLITWTYVEAYDGIFHKKLPDREFAEELETARDLLRKLSQKLNLKMTPEIALLVGLIEKVPREILELYAEKYDGNVCGLPSLSMAAYYFLKSRN